MKIRNSKKGLLFNLVIGLAAIIILIGSIIVFLNSPERTLSDSLGQKQYTILNHSAAAEKTIFFIKQTAKYQIRPTFNKICSNGGFEQDSACGQHNGINLWNNGEIFCQPDYLDAFSHKMNKRIDEAKANYPSEIPEENYALSLSDKGKSILFIAKNPISIETEDTKYSYYPSFKINTPSDFAVIPQIFGEAQEVIEEVQSEDLSIEKALKNRDGWAHLSSNNPHHAFSVQRGDFTVKFALYIDTSENEAPQQS